MRTRGRRTCRSIPSLFACDPEMTWAHPKAKGGWSSHAADLTSRSATETVDMAKATYDALIRYPVIGTKQRTPAPWEKVRPQLDGFIKASTKAEKQAWFASQGNTDPSFLSGISLSDGPQPFTLGVGRSPAAEADGVAVAPARNRSEAARLLQPVLRRLAVARRLRRARRGEPRCGLCSEARQGRRRRSDRAGGAPAVVAHPGSRRGCRAGACADAVDARTARHDHHPGQVAGRAGPLCRSRPKRSFRW